MHKCNAWVCSFQGFCIVVNPPKSVEVGRYKSTPLVGMLCMGGGYNKTLDLVHFNKRIPWIDGHAKLALPTFGIHVIMCEYESRAASYTNWCEQQFGRGRSLLLRARNILFINVWRRMTHLCAHSQLYDVYIVDICCAHWRNNKKTLQT